MSRRINTLLIALCAALALVSVPLRSTLAESAGEYRIDVDVANQITTVYRRADGAVVRQMICSTGIGDTTPRGAFTLQTSRSSDRKEWYFIGKYQCYVKFPTRIQGSILFHSLPYAAQSMEAVDPEAVEQLGSKASHGCVRLRWEDAEWIAAHCPDGTETRIFTGARNESDLRQLLLEESYSSDSGLSYEAFVAPIHSIETFTLGRGARGDAVSALQRQLGRLGYFVGRPTGEYDSATVVAIMRYQSAIGLSPTGVATQALFERIMTDGATP
ncbi:MAG: L,D-transpeptidase family protein [Clostridia bacterium]|nr:L,D-transpeptidase family protein [Clostridia bacterium]